MTEQTAPKVPAERAGTGMRMYALQTRDQGVLSYTIASTPERALMFFDNVMNAKRALVSPMDPISICEIFSVRAIQSTKTGRAP